jgi:hypothetical protein
MSKVSRCLLAIIVCGLCCLEAAAQCPARPNPGSVVQDALSLSSQNGVLNARFTMGN